MTRRGVVDLRHRTLFPHNTGARCEHCRYLALHAYKLQSPDGSRRTFCAAQCVAAWLEDQRAASDRNDEGCT